MIRIGGHFRVVGHQDNGLAVAAGKRGDHLHNLAPAFRIQIAGGLIGKHDIGLRDKRARDAHALLLTARHLGRIMLQPLLQPDTR